MFCFRLINDQMANILFVDLPVGTGCSYAKTPRANYSGDFRSSFHVNQFLRKVKILSILYFLLIPFIIIIIIIITITSYDNHCDKWR